MMFSLFPALHKILMRRERVQGATENVESDCSRPAKSPPQFRKLVYVIVERTLSKDLVNHRANGPRMTFKWEAEASYPSYDTIAKRMGVTDKMVHRYAQSLQKKGYVQRLFQKRGPNRFDLSGLFRALAS